MRAASTGGQVGGRCFHRRGQVRRQVLKADRTVALQSPDAWLLLFCGTDQLRLQDMMSLST